MGFFDFLKKNETTSQGIEVIPGVDVESCMAENFSMKIDEVCTVVRHGTIATGTIESGICRISEQGYISFADIKIPIAIGGIHLTTKKRKSNAKAYKGETVGLLLRGVVEEQVPVGGTIVIENAVKQDV